MPRDFQDIKLVEAVVTSKHTREIAGLKIETSFRKKNKDESDEDYREAAAIFEYPYDKIQAVEIYTGFPYDLIVPELLLEYLIELSQKDADQIG